MLKRTNCCNACVETIGLLKQEKKVNNVLPTYKKVSFKI